MYTDIERFKFYVHKENEFNVHVYKELQFIKEN